MENLCFGTAGWKNQRRDRLTVERDQVLRGTTRSWNGTSTWQRPTTPTGSSTHTGWDRAGPWIRLAALRTIMKKKQRRNSGEMELSIRWRLPTLTWRLWTSCLVRTARWSKVRRGKSVTRILVMLETTVRNHLLPPSRTHPSSQVKVFANFTEGIFAKDYFFVVAVKVHSIESIYIFCGSCLKISLPFCFRIPSGRSHTCQTVGHKDWHPK